MGNIQFNTITIVYATNAVIGKFPIRKRSVFLGDAHNSSAILHEKIDGAVCGETVSIEGASR